MPTEQNLRNVAPRGITRRLAITGIAASIASATSARLLAGRHRSVIATNSKELRNFVVVVSTPLTKLWVASDGAGNLPDHPTKEGIVLACPQSCASKRPGYAEAVANRNLGDIYLNTSEWMREIIFTADDLSQGKVDSVGQPDQQVARKTWRSYRKFLGFNRVTNDASTTGCGHISRNVTITKLTKMANGKFQEDLIGVTYSSLVFNSIPNPLDPFYEAKDIYIFSKDWTPLPADPMGTNVKKVVQAIDTDERPIDVSACLS